MNYSSNYFVFIYLFFCHCWVHANLTILSTGNNQLAYHFLYYVNFQNINLWVIFCSGIQNSDIGTRLEKYNIWSLQFLLFYGLINFSLPSSIAKTDSYQFDKNEICLTSQKVIILHTLFVIKKCLHNDVYVIHA